MCFLPTSLFFTLCKTDSLDPELLSREAQRGRGQEKGMKRHADKHFICPYVLQLDAAQGTHFFKRLAAAMCLSDCGSYRPSIEILPRLNLFGN